MCRSGQALPCRRKRPKYSVRRGIDQPRAPAKPPSRSDSIWARRPGVTRSSASTLSTQSCVAALECASTTTISSQKLTEARQSPMRPASLRVMMQAVSPGTRICDRSAALPRRAQARARQRSFRLAQMRQVEHLSTELQGGDTGIGAKQRDDFPGRCDLGGARRKAFVDDRNLLGMNRELAAEAVAT